MSIVFEHVLGTALRWALPTVDSFGRGVFEHALGAALESFELYFLVSLSFEVPCSLESLTHAFPTEGTETRKYPLNSIS